MKKVILLIVCLFGVSGVWAQETIFIVKAADGKATVVSDVVIDYRDVNSLDVWNKDQIRAKFGQSDNPPEIVLDLELNPGIELLTRQQLLDHYAIPETQRSLPLIVDRGKAKRADGKLLVDLSVVDSVRIENNDAHIAIYTKYYLNHPDMTPTLSDLQVTMDRKEFERVDSSPRPAWIEKESQKRPAPWFISEIGRVQIGNYLPERDRSLNSETNQIYRMKETGELVIVTSVYSLLLKEKGWDEVAADRVNGYCRSGGDQKKCVVEYLDDKKYRAVIYFIDKNVRRAANRIMYKSLERDAFLEIIYLSDLPADERMKNMRKILAGLKMGGD